jgi:hypothetical protein
MKMIAYLITLLTCFAATPSTAQTVRRNEPGDAIVREQSRSVTLEHLQAECATTTHVYKGDGTRIGETLDGYCTGFLEGAFALMLRAKSICPDRRVDPDFLLSVLSIYVDDQHLTSVDAGEAIAAAYQRAFPCKN